jgi:hypothetical protein
MSAVRVKQSTCAVTAVTSVSANGGKAALLHSIEHASGLYCSNVLTERSAYSAAVIR